MSTIYTIYEWLYEKNTFFSGYYDSLGRKGLVLRSIMDQYDKTYKLTVEEPQAGGETKTTHLEVDVGKVFDVEGNLHVDILRDLYDNAVGRKERDREDEKDKGGKKKAKKK